jgi:hypothetical protein
MEKYEEYKVLKKPFWGWGILIAFSAAILGWGMFVEMVIQETPRQWDFGTLPDTPAESVYSTAPHPPEVNAPIQVPQVPGSGWDKKAGKFIINGVVH